MISTHANLMNVFVCVQDYFNCSCILSNSTFESGAQVTSGVCPVPVCTELIVFSVLIFLAMVGLFMSEAMNISALYRSVYRH